MNRLLYNPCVHKLLRAVVAPLAEREQGSSKTQNEIQSCCVALCIVHVSSVLVTLYTIIFHI